MRIARIVSIVATALALGTPLAPLGAQTTSAPPGDATRGKAAFLGYGCYECHGTRGQGNYMSAPHIAPKPVPFGTLIAYIRRPAGEMPSYAAAILPDKDVADIYAYLSSIPAGKPASAIPQLSAVTTTPK